MFRDGKATVDNGEVPTTRRIFNNELKDWICPLLEMHFSILESGAVIAPHCDLWNFTINLHFAVDIPEDCAIKVANETRTWEEGKCLLFDYSYLHEAWNHSVEATGSVMQRLPSCAHPLVAAEEGHEILDGQRCYVRPQLESYPLRWHLNADPADDVSV